MAEIDNPVIGFMYWYAKLFIIGINRKRFELISTYERLCAVNNSRNTIFAILFYGLGSMFFFSGAMELSNQTGHITTEFIIVFFVVHPVVAIISLRQFLWLVNGKQELTVEDGNLTLRKRGTFFTSDKVYPLKSIKNIRKAVDEEQLSPVERVTLRFSIFRKVFFKQVFGEILFEYQYDTIGFFNELDNEDKEKLITELVKWQDSLSQTPPLKRLKK